MSTGTPTLYVLAMIICAICSLYAMIQMFRKYPYKLYNMEWFIFLITVIVIKRMFLYFSKASNSEYDTARSIIVVVCTSIIVAVTCYATVRQRKEIRKHKERNKELNFNAENDGKHQG